MQTFGWLFIGLVHVFFVPALNQMYETKCPEVAEVAEAEATEASIVEDREPTGNW